MGRATANDTAQISHRLDEVSSLVSPARTVTDTEKKSCRESKYRQPLVFANRHPSLVGHEARDKEDGLCLARPVLVVPIQMLLRCIRRHWTRDEDCKTLLHFPTSPSAD